MTEAEKLAKFFHDTYEELAPSHGYETREASRKPWDDVPEQNKGLMVEVAQKVLDRLSAIDTLPAWLYQRYTPAQPLWEDLSESDRSYWEHEARAVRRAVARNGFKDA